MLLDSLANCIRERISRESLDTLHDALEDRLKSVEDPYVELIEALANYVYQLRDGAIQASDDTTSLFREALALLGQDDQAIQSPSRSDQTASLLERIDLEASGGFDALEAGEVPDVERMIESNSETFRIQNTLHRLQASLKTLERHAQVTRSTASAVPIFSHHRRLLDSLAPNPQRTQSVSLASLEEMLTLQLGESDTEINMVAEGAVQPSYIPALAALIAQLTATLSDKDIKEIKISHVQDELEIQLTCTVNDSGISSLRTSAINRGFLHAEAALRDGVEMQYLMLAESIQADERLIQSSALLDHLQALCASVAVESSTETTLVSVTLPSDVKSEQVTVFRKDGALYAISTDAIIDVDYATNYEEVSFGSSLENEFGSFRVVKLNHTEGTHEACLLINDGGVRVALFVDHMEPPGQFIVRDSLTSNTHYGGGVRLEDRRFVVLLSAIDLDDARELSLDSQPSTNRRLLVLGRVPHASRLSRKTYRVSHAAGELDATAEMQEQLPHAVLVEQHELNAYGHLLTKAKRLGIPVIVQKSANQEAAADSLNSNFETVTTLTDLETRLQKLDVQQG